MSNYKRHYQAGGSYFFTLVTYDRKPIFASEANIKHFKYALNKVKGKYPFSMQAIVILPDHLHCILQLPQNDYDFSMRWRLIKRHCSVEINSSFNHRKEKQIWQRRFWEHAIRDADDWRQHMDYIHYNPVKHGIVESPADWKHSSFHYWVAREIYDEDWGSCEPKSLIGMREVE